MGLRMVAGRRTIVDMARAIDTTEPATDSQAAGPSDGGSPSDSRSDSANQTREQRRARSSRGVRALRLVAATLATGVAVVLGSALLLGMYILVIWLRVPDAAAIAERYGRAESPANRAATAFMSTDGCEQHRRHLVPLSEIDPRLVCAVVWAEDWRFFAHDGVDWPALEGAMRENWRRGRPRLGGSTIAMQLARNLYLTRARTPSRKLREVFLAPRLVSALGRERVLELYLNAAEWAPCVYGAEAAARHYFGRGAGVLDAAQAVFLAAMLPRPSRPPGERDRQRLIKRQQTLLTHLGRAGLLRPTAVRRARAQVFANVREQIARSQTGGPAPSGRPSGAVTKDRSEAGMPASREWLVRACGTMSVR